MTEVVFSQYSFRTEDRAGKPFIFDEVRKKWVSLTPEEWVRQHILHYLIYSKGYPKSLLAVERGIELNGLQKRFDVVAFSAQGNPLMIIECKAPDEALNDKVFTQIATYNQSLRVKCLWVTNGQLNYCCRLGSAPALLPYVPTFEELQTG